MGRPQYQTNARAMAAWNDLDRFRNFCVEYGYRFREEDLYNFKTYAWQQYNKWAQGKNTKNMWEEDTRRFSGYRYSR